MPVLAARRSLSIAGSIWLVAATVTASVGCSFPEYSGFEPQPEAGALDGGKDVEAGPPPTCNDGVKNGEETDVDCGGKFCGRCEAGSTCKVQNDCKEGICTNGVCRVPSCTDTVQNGSETDVDCGDSCAPCQVGKACKVGPDCS